MGLGIISKLNWLTIIALSDLHAALGLSQLPKLASVYKRQRRSIGELIDTLMPTYLCVCPAKDSYCQQCWHLYMVELTHTTDWVGFYQQLHNKGIGEMCIIFQVICSLTTKISVFVRATPKYETTITNMHWLYPFFLVWLKKSKTRVIVALMRYYFEFGDYSRARRKVKRIPQKNH